MVEAIQLAKTFPGSREPVTAVAPLDLRVAPGEFLVICGRSGSGKSTLLGMLGGLCRPSGGTVLLDGVDLWSLSPGDLADFRNRRVGFVFQFASLLPSLRAIDNVALPAMLGGDADMKAAYARAETLLRQVGLADRMEAYPSELSGGEQRRVALARALVNDPPLLLADEPTADLDEETEAAILDLLLRLHRERGTTLIVVTHSPEIARRADRVLHLRRGALAPPGSEGTLSRSETPPDRRVRVPALPGTDSDLPWAPEAPLDPKPGSPSSWPDTSPLPHFPTSPLLPAPLGAGLFRLLGEFAAWLALVLLAVLALNFGAAALQRRSLVRQRTARQRLAHAALQQLRADIENITLAPDGTYRLTVYLRNQDPARPLFALTPAVRVYVQVGRDWVEVPSQQADSKDAGVLEITDTQRFLWTFRPAVGKFEEQIPGYMHVRVANALLVSATRQPKEGLFDRNDAYYLYLKPPHADDAAIRRANGWSGRPPLWIPMPPH